MSKVKREKINSKNELINADESTSFEKHRLIFEFWGQPEPTPIDNTCHVYFDKNAFFKQGQNVLDRIEAEKLYEEQGLKPSTLQGLGAEQALNRERRLNQLSDMISSGEVTTVEQAILKLDGIRTEASVVTYLKEIGKKLKLARTGEIVGSDEPVKTQRSPIDRFKQIDYKYYDGDHLKGGKEISKKEYDRLKDKALDELREQLKESE